MDYNSKIEFLSKKFPTKIVLTDSKMSINYSELIIKRDKYIAYFNSKKISKGARVAVLLEKNIETVAILLACLKLGIVFCPLDLNCPDERLSFYLNTITPKLVIYKDLVRKSIFDSIQVNNLTFETEIAVNDRYIEEYRELDAYCIFTSGSTSVPKGVVISQGSLIDLCENLKKDFLVEPLDNFLSLGPMFFDIIVIDLLYPLYHGAHIILYDLPYPLPNIQLEMIKKHNISVICGVTRLFEGILNQQEKIQENKLISLRKIMTGGELVTNKLLNRIKKYCDNLEVYNGYGPTEFTCTCILYKVKESDFIDKYNIPIGKGIQGVYTKIVDEYQNESTEGELVISGSQMFKYYINANSNESLLNLNGVNYYKTGDIVEIIDGEMIYKGRKNEEMKINGVRLNPNEVLSLIDRCFNFDQSNIVIIKDVNNSNQQCLILSPTVDNNDLIVDEINNELKKHLPKYHIPKYIYIIDDFPLQPGGKGDLKKLKTIAEEFIKQKG